MIAVAGLAIVAIRVDEMVHRVVSDNAKSRHNCPELLCLCHCNKPPSYIEKGSGKRPDHDVGHLKPVIAGRSPVLVDVSPVHVGLDVAVHTDKANEGIRLRFFSRFAPPSLIALL